MSRPDAGSAPAEQPSRAEARVLILGTLGVVPLWAFGLLSAMSSDRAQADGKGPLVLAVAGFLVIAVLLQGVRSRVRHRAGKSAIDFSGRGDLRLLREAATASGWPVRLVQATLLITWIGCIALVLYAIFRPASG